jgi:hypothetical protein
LNYINKLRAFDYSKVNHEVTTTNNSINRHASRQEDSIENMPERNVKLFSFDRKMVGHFTSLRVLTSTGNSDTLLKNLLFDAVDKPCWTGIV